MIGADKAHCSCAAQIWRHSEVHLAVHRHWELPDTQESVAEGVDANVQQAEKTGKECSNWQTAQQLPDSTSEHDICQPINTTSANAARSRSCTRVACTRHQASLIQPNDHPNVLLLFNVIQIPAITDYNLLVFTGKPDSHTHYT